MRKLLVQLGVYFLICAVRTCAQPPAQAQDLAKAPASTVSSPHRFWDSANIRLFVGVVATRTLDYTSTRHLRKHGVNEWLLTNDIVDNRPLFVTIEAAATAASIGLAYWLHRRGNHRLERWVSVIHIGVGVGGSIRNYTLQGATRGPLS